MDEYDKHTNARCDIHVRRSRSDTSPSSFVMFDFDGTISLLRDGWPNIMGEMMLAKISGGDLQSSKLIMEVEEYIASSAGIQTIAQMRHLVTLIEQYGIVPRSKIRGAMHYKKIYDDLMRNLVNARSMEIERAYATREDYMLPGVKEFILWLDSQSIPLYLVSGTDKEDVIREANRLGIAPYFKAIFGPSPTDPGYSKERTLRHLLAVHPIGNNSALIVGDGPVEIALGSKYGLHTLGVAYESSDRELAYVTKVEKLMEAGADLIIQQFCPLELIVDYLPFLRVQ